MSTVTYTPEEIAEHRRLWAAALRDQYRQGRNRLRNIDGTFCCLGVACDLYNKDLWNEVNEYELGSYFPADNYPPPPVLEWLGITYEQARGLAQHNDGVPYEDAPTPETSYLIAPHDFSAIASMIEEDKIPKHQTYDELVRLQPPQPFDDNVL